MKCFDNCQSIRVYCRGDPETPCRGMIFFNGVGICVGFRTVSEFVQYLEQLDLDTPLQIKKFLGLVNILRTTKLASCSVSDAYDPRIQQSFILQQNLHRLRGFLPELQEVEQIIQFFFRHAHILVDLEKGLRLPESYREDPDYGEFNGLVIESHVEENTKFPTLKCGRVICKKRGTILCVLCENISFCSLSCMIISSDSHAVVCSRTVLAKMCARPSCTNTGTSLCGRCLQVRYCSRKCQVIHYHNHKRQCPK